MNETVEGIFGTLNQNDVVCFCRKKPILQSTYGHDGRNRDLQFKMTDGDRISRAIWAAAALLLFGQL